ncbi:unnamed protein product, partial [Nesidiocoris tenuis]
MEELLRSAMPNRRGERTDQLVHLICHSANVGWKGFLFVLGVRFPLSFDLPTGERSDVRSERFVYPAVRNRHMDDPFK